MLWKAIVIRLITQGAHVDLTIVSHNFYSKQGMRIEKLLVRSKRRTSCFLSRANTCKTGFGLCIALLSVTIFSPKTLETNCFTGFHKKITLSWPIKNALFMSMHAELEDILKSISPRRISSIYFAWGKLSFQDKMTGGFSGKKLFVGGLPPKVDEKALRDVFSRFWHIEEGLSVWSARIETYERCHWSQFSWAFLNIIVHWLIQYTRL